MNLRNRAVLLLALCGCALVSCNSTRVVIADPDRGVERAYSPDDVDGERMIRLQYDRARLTDGEDIKAPPICYSCVGEEPEEGRATFNLMFFAVNDTGRQWQLRANMFHLRREDGPGEPQTTDEVELERDLPQPNADGLHSRDPDPVLASIAPFSTARIPVLFTVRGVDIHKNDSRIYGTYELRVYQDSAVLGATPVDEMPNVLLERHLSLGRFHQGSQALRFAAFFAVTLLALGSL